MKILLINIDSVTPNLALKKIEKYYLDRGEEVIWDLPLARNIVDKIYVSCIFTKNKHLCREWEGIAEIGGTGYDLYKKTSQRNRICYCKNQFWIYYTGMYQEMSVLFRSGKRRHGACGW